MNISIYEHLMRPRMYLPGLCQECTFLTCEVCVMICEAQHRNAMYNGNCGIQCKHVSVASAKVVFDLKTCPAIPQS